MPTTVSTWFWVVTTFLFGVSIGSFLNVVIYRLPRASATLNLAKPASSFCPNCSHQQTAADLIPLLSFLALGRRCRSCKQPISSRYFWVELLTGLVFVVLYLHFLQDIPNAVALILFTAVLIPIFFIDLATFEIQTSLNLLIFVIAVGRDVGGIALHEPDHALLWGWLPRSLFGAAVGIAIFGVIRISGWLWRGVEAMGLGDVLLARAMGAMLVSVVPIGMNPARLIPIWVLFSCFSGIVVGPALILFRRRQEKTSKVTSETETEATEEPEEDFGREGTFGQQIMDIGYCFWLGDAVEYVYCLFAGLRGKPCEEVPFDDSVPAPTAIPFGPFLVIGFLATVFWGEWVTAAYLAYAIPHSPPLP